MAPEAPIIATALTEQRKDLSAHYVVFIKGYLRSTMGEIRLSSLAHITIHREITIDIENILDILAQKQRKLKILH